MVQLPHLYMTTLTIALTKWVFVGKVISLLLNMLSRFVIAFLSISKHFLKILWLQSPSTVILEPKKNLPLFLLFPHQFAMKFGAQDISGDYR